MAEAQPSVSEEVVEEALAETFKGMEEPEVGDCKLKQTAAGQPDGAKRELDALVKEAEEDGQTLREWARKLPAATKACEKQLFWAVAAKFNIVDGDRTATNR
eukprot:COSAG04_NODE_6337_length_1353_cov_2.255183_2_plen_102_part_00